MSANTREGYQTPVPNREVEMKTQGSGPVTTYQLSPEELERYRAMPTKTVRDGEGKVTRKPISFQSVRNTDNKPKEMKDVKESKITKEIYLQLRVEGLSDQEIAKKFDIGTASLKSYYKKKFGLLDPDQEELAILEARGAIPDDPVPAEVPVPAEAADPVVPPAGLIAINAVRASEEMVARLDAELNRLKGEVEKITVERDDYKRAAEDLEGKHGEFDLLESIRSNEIRILKADVDALSASALERSYENSKLKAEINVMQDIINKSPTLVAPGLPAKPSHTRSLQTELTATAEHIVDVLRAKVNYLRSAANAGQHFYLDLQLDLVDMVSENVEVSGDFKVFDVSEALG